MPNILIQHLQIAGKTVHLYLSEGRITPVTEFHDLEVEHCIYAKGLMAVPAFRDQHVHFRDPGYLEKETLLTGARAAAAGGYVTVACEANTLPVIDDRAGVERFYQRVAEFGIPLNISTKIALSKGQRGEEISNIPLDMLGKEMSSVSSDGEPVVNKELLISALRLINGRVAIDLHCEETPGSEAKVRKILGEGIPGAREVDLIRFALQALTEAGCGWLHIQHVSLAASVKLISEARRSGLHVTSEVTPHHLLLSQEDIPLRNGELDANWKMNPPLRTREDMFAMRKALAGGEIDFIATDHAPHTSEEKSRPWREAPYGVIGLETAFAACMSLVHKCELSFSRLIDAMSRKQSIDDIATLSGITLIDFDWEWWPDADYFYSRSRNCPFVGEKLHGKVRHTILKKENDWQMLYNGDEVLF